jgi:hypothetical protein
MIRVILRTIFRVLSIIGYYGSMLCRNAFQGGWRGGIWLDRTLIRRT